LNFLYFDCFSGISGDMTLGALLDLGIDKGLFLSELGKLRLEGYNINIVSRTKNGIVGTNVEVLLTEECVKEPQEVQHTHSAHGHDQHSHTLNNTAAEHHHNTHNARNLRDIEKLIDLSELTLNVKEFSKKVFREIAGAEAKVHNKAIDEVHFHEVGAVDSIVDIVGTAICLDMLGVDKVYSSPLHDGKGFIECQHGVIPVPVPAVMEMLSGSKIPLISEDVGTELVTPTGMGIIKVLANAFGDMPAALIEKVGYGMGKRETGRFNALRIMLGTFAENRLHNEEVIILETNIDDSSPEILGYVVGKLLDSGALDVFYTPIYMKKNRPAYMLTVISSEKNEAILVDIILKETSTLGIRKNRCERYCMNRDIINVATPFGEVRVKVASMGDFKKIAPEYEDCKAIANRTGRPLKEIFESVMEYAKITGMKND
jgi:pyridinium-3,5-bisthiocarboxylic acid mononucleotide nickel chelatase